jgi:uncharacterized membrane protein
MESPARTLVKTITYRIGGAFVTGAVALAITGELASAATIGVADTVLKLGAYYVHERLWNRVSFGRQEPPDYEI